MLLPPSLCAGPILPAAAKGVEQQKPTEAGAPDDAEAEVVAEVVSAAAIEEAIEEAEATPEKVSVALCGGRGAGFH